MANDQTMRIRSQIHNRNVTNRGRVSETRKPKSNKWDKSTYMMAVFFFLLVGSIVFQMFRASKGGNF